MQNYQKIGLFVFNKKFIIRQLSSKVEISLKTDKQLQSDVEGITKRDPEWDNALPFEKLPGPSKSALVKSFLPGGEFYKMDSTAMYMVYQKRYGDILRLPGIFGSSSKVLTYNADNYRKVFRTEGVWPIRRGLDSITYYRKVARPDVFKGFGGLATEQGAKWASFRSTVNPTMMKPKTVKLYVPKIDLVASDFLNRIREIRNTETFEMPPNFEDELNRWALESVGTIALDARLGLINEVDNPRAKKAIGALKIFFELLYELDIQPSIWKYVKTPKFNKYIHALDSMTEVVTEYIDEAKKNLEENCEKYPENHEESVLEKLLKVDTHVAYIMALDLIIAGVDTTTTAFVSCLYQLAKSPEKQSKLREELKTILPNKDSPLTPENMKNMPYLRACVKEAIRIYPVTVVNSRTTGQDIVLNGYQIPKGTDIIMGAIINHHDAKHFPKPMEFIPERWLRKQQTLTECPAARTADPFTYLPFGFGPRMCIGKRFAELEIEVLLSRLIRNCEVEWNQPDLKFRANIINVPNGLLQFKITDIVHE